MKHQYRIQFSCDMGAVLDPVADMLKRVNGYLASAGCSEQLSVRSKLFSMTLTTEHQLNERHKDIVKQILLKEFATMQPAWKVQVESFRRKSGNVQQSVSQ